MNRPRNLDIAATKAEPLPANPAPGAEPLPKDSERVMAGPGVAFTERMWHDAWILGLIGLIGGGAVGAVVGVVWQTASSGSLAVAVICTAVFALAGSVAGFVLGGMQGAAEDSDPELSRSDTFLARR
jgi:hypothetical protein